MEALSSYIAFIVCGSIISTTLIRAVLSPGSSSTESLSTSHQWFHFQDLPPLSSSWMRTHHRQYHQRYLGRSSSRKSMSFLFSPRSHKTTNSGKSHHDQETIIEVMEEHLDNYNGDYHRQLDYDTMRWKESNDIAPPFGLSNEYYDLVRRRRGHRGNEVATSASTSVAAKTSGGSSWIRSRRRERPVASLFGTQRMRNKPTGGNDYGFSNNYSDRINSKPKSRVTRKSRARSGYGKGCGKGPQKRGCPTSTVDGPGGMRRRLFRETEDYDYGFDQMTQRQGSEGNDIEKLYLRHREESRWSEGDNLRHYAPGCAGFYISEQWYFKDKEPTGARVSNMAESMIRHGDGIGQSYLSSAVVHLGSESSVSSRERLLKTLQPRGGFVYLKTTKSPASSPSMSTIPTARLRKMPRHPRLPMRALTLKQ